MSYGDIISIKEDYRLEWKIPDFFSLDSVKHNSIQSPSFLFADRTWCLTVYPKGNEKPGFMSAYLALVNRTNIPKKLSSFSLGLKASDGSWEEIMNVQNATFDAEDKIGRDNFLDLARLERRKSYLAPSGNLTVACKLLDQQQFVPNLEGEGYHQKKLLELETLSLDLKNLLSTEKKSDVTLKVKGKDFKAHHSVLSARSPVFCAMFEHDTSEKETRIVTIPDCDPDSFGQFLSYLYTGRMEDISFQTAYHLYSTSDKYDVQQLKSFCTEYLKNNLKMENVCDVIVLAD